MVLPFPTPEKSLAPNYPKLTQEEPEFYRGQINCNFEQLDAVFEDCMMEARALLSEQGIAEKEEQGLPPRHYPEWDYNNSKYRPDWVSLYESLHPSGKAADIDDHDDQLLIQDSHKAVQELDQKGIFTYCINLDPKADEYVQDIFGQQYTVIDKVERLPEKCRSCLWP